MRELMKIIKYTKTQGDESFDFYFAEGVDQRIAELEAAIGKAVKELDGSIFEGTAYRLRKALEDKR